MTAELTFIGSITTPYAKLEDCPRNIQSEGPPCQLVLDQEYQDGLAGLVPGQSILILYWLVNTDRSAVQQCTRNGREIMGTFSLRSPHRPNPIGAAVLPIETIEDGRIVIRGLDCLNGTKLLDIKPAVLHEKIVTQN